MEGHENFWHKIPINLLEKLLLRAFDPSSNKYSMKLIKYLLHFQKRLIQFQFITLQQRVRNSTAALPWIPHSQTASKMHANYDLFDMKIFEFAETWENPCKISSSILRFHVFHAIKHHVKHISTSSGNFFSMKPQRILPISTNLTFLPWHFSNFIVYGSNAANFIKFRSYNIFTKIDTVKWNSEQKMSWNLASLHQRHKTHNVTDIVT